LNYLREQKNQEIKDLRQENLRLKGRYNKVKQGVTITDGDMQSNIGLGEMLMEKLIPSKYHTVVRPLLPKAEAYLAEHKDEIIEQIQSINNKQTKSRAPEDQDLTTL
jgi:hypothetical protein